MQVHAQQTSPGNLPKQSIYLEIGGASNLAGLSYERRFSGNDRFGWRTGVAFVYAEHMSIFTGSDDLRGWTVPIEVNYLTGRRKSHLELGVGINLGYYNEHTHYYYYQHTGEVDGIYQYDVEQRHDTRNTWGHFFYGNIGYRYQAKSGFQFRAGISPSFNLGGDHAVSKSFFWPYLSLGYAF
ncbi:MAG: hypothetical protein IJ196_04245 [Prevotella sp.]|nr:hypothetical protein [Prevotella sp.]